MILKVNTKSKDYQIVLERGLLEHINDYYFFNDSKVLIITDNGVPKYYLEMLMKQIPHAISLIVKQGEQAKSLENFILISQTLLNNNFSRKDILIALGGGVVGDLTGFVASTYKRSIRFINIPTTTLSQIDSSVGGKTAINFNGVKNVIGTFYQPEIVFIDFNTLNTLPKRHFYNGLVEALKIGLILSKELYDIFKKENYLDYLDEIIVQAIKLKINVVENDEHESHYRQILNFGHTLAHGFESLFSFEEIYHGEAVANGMIYMIEDCSLKKEVEEIINKMKIKKIKDFSTEEIMKYIKNDKKVDDHFINIVLLNQVSQVSIEKKSFDDVKQRIEVKNNE